MAARAVYLPAAAANWNHCNTIMFSKFKHRAGGPELQLACWLLIFWLSPRELAMADDSLPVSLMSHFSATADGPGVTSGLAPGGRYFINFNPQPGSVLATSDFTINVPAGVRQVYVNTTVIAARVVVPAATSASLVQTVAAERPGPAVAALSQAVLDVALPSSVQSVNMDTVAGQLLVQARAH